MELENEQCEQTPGYATSNVKDKDTKHEGRPHRETTLSSKALTKATSDAENKMSVLWTKIKRTLSNMPMTPGPPDTIETEILSEQYNSAWIELAKLYALNDSDDSKDDAAYMESRYLRNKQIITTELDEARTPPSRPKQQSEPSVTCTAISKASSRLSAARAHALAEAAAAAEEAEFEKTIARQEADIKILKAEKKVATTRASAEVFQRAMEEETTQDMYTTPQQSSNDHASHFRTRTEQKQLRPEASPYFPTSAYPAQKHGVERLQPIVQNTTPERPNDLSSSDVNPPQFPNEYVQILARQRLPVQEPEVYGGDPIMFLPWKKTFQSMVQTACVPTSERLSFLSRYTKGEPKTLVDRYRLRYARDVDAAYREAWNDLEERFGNPAVITAVIIRKLTSFPKIRIDDGHKLLELADLCVDTVSHMKELIHLNTLNSPHGLNPIVERLPNFIVNKWREKVASYKQTYTTFPPFNYFTEFLRNVARTQNDPDVPKPNNTASTTDKVKFNRQEYTNARVHITKTLSDGKQCVYHEFTGHDITDCKAFIKQPLAERIELCRKKGLCFKCTQKHLARDCNTQIKCSTCQSTKHVTCMHSMPGETTKPSEQGVEQERKGARPEVTTKCTRLAKCPAGRSCGKIVLAKVYKQDKPMDFVETYVVLDDQSNACLGDTQLFDALKIQGPELEYELSTCSNKGERRKGRRGNHIIIESIDGKKKYPLPVILENDDLPSNKDEIPTPEVCNSFKHLKPIADKIPALRHDVGIHLLIGRSCSEPLKVRETRNGPMNSPWAQRTDLGWTVSGELCMKTARGVIRASVHHTIAVVSNLDIQNPRTVEERIECDNHIYARDIVAHKPVNTGTNIFEETQDDEKTAISLEDKQFLTIMQQGAHINCEGNLELPLPFKQDPVKLPNNRQSALNRFNNLLSQFRRKPEMMTQYLQFMGKVIERQHASVVPMTELDANNTWYLPHFGVHHPKKQQLRVVFDSSAKLDGVSLNDVLLQGPDQMNSLLGVLLRFRREPIAVMGDIEQMFHSFHVNKEHRDYLRFFWFQENDPRKPVIQYRMNVHLFGNVSSPAIATFGLRMIAEENLSGYGEDVKKFIHTDFYVDDGLTSQPDVTTAISLIKRTREMLATRNINFHKVVSNNKEVMSALPNDVCGKDLQCLDFSQDTLPTQRSLGVQWSLQTDTFTFQVDLKEKPFSRRGVLAIVNSIYDPLGILAPVCIEGKRILRDLMTDTTKGLEKTTVGWDDPLPAEYQPRWTRWCDSLIHVEKVHVQRCYSPPGFGPIKESECHIFSDASDTAIGAVAYLRIVNHQGKVNVTFLIGKAKVNPSHAVSIPRLELCAAVLATELAQKITSEIRSTIDHTLYYTDSTIVLGYINNRSKRFHVYVANRVQRIHNISSPNQWRHVSTDQNPADLATRYVQADRLCSTIWLKGPHFLWQPNYEHLPETPLNVNQCEYEVQEEDPEVRKQTRTLATTIKNSLPKDTINNRQRNLGSERFNRFSSWTVLKRAVAKVK